MMLPIYAMRKGDETRSEEARYYHDAYQSWDAQVCLDRASRLGKASFEEFRAEGSAMTAKQAVERALGVRA